MGEYPSLRSWTSISPGHSDRYMGEGFISLSGKEYDRLHYVYILGQVGERFQLGELGFVSTPSEIAF